MNAHIKKLVLVVLVALGITYVIGLQQYLTLANIKEYRGMLQELVRQHYWYTVILFMIVNFTLIAFSAPVGGVLTLLAGFLFGTIPATIYVVISATLGGTSAFLMTRYVFGHSVERRYPHYAQRLNEELARRGHGYLLAIRLMSLFPFFIVNFLVGLTRISWRTFVWTTALGIVPATIVFAFAGRQLETISTLHDVLSWRIIVALILMAILAVVPLFIHDRKSSTASVAHEKIPDHESDHES